MQQTKTREWTTKKPIISDRLAPLIGGMLQLNLNDFSILKH